MAAAEAWGTVLPDHPVFAGHFPGHPIVPGVLLLDRVLQLAQAQRGTPGEAWQVVQAKFLSPVGPGEALCVRVEPTPRGSLAFTVHAAERLVASGNLAVLPA